MVTTLVLTPLSSVLTPSFVSVLIPLVYILRFLHHLSFHLWFLYHCYFFRFLYHCHYSWVLPQFSCWFSISSYTNDDWIPIPNYTSTIPSRNAYWSSPVSKRLHKVFSIKDFSSKLTMILQENLSSNRSSWMIVTNQWAGFHLSHPQLNNPSLKYQGFIKQLLKDRQVLPKSKNDWMIIGIATTRGSSESYQNSKMIEWS